MEKSKHRLIHNKGDKKLLKNYRAISLLPMCGKMFERIIFNIIFKLNNLLSLHQPGFIMGDLCVQQLIDIIHEIHKAFDCSPSFEA